MSHIRILCRSKNDRMVCVLYYLCFPKLSNQSTSIVYDIIPANIFNLRTKNNDKTKKMEQIFWWSNLKRAEQTEVHLSQVIY